MADKDYRSSRSVGVIVVIILVILVVGGFIFAISQLFGGDDPVQKPDITSGSYSLRMRAIGPIEANETHEEYSITVGPNSRSMTIYEGYANDALVERRYGNVFEAFEDFAAALNRSGFGDQRDVEGNEADFSGACPRGTRYVFETLSSSGQVIASQWTSSCRGASGTLDVDPSVSDDMEELFEAQIPDFRDLERQANDLRDQ